MVAAVPVTMALRDAFFAAGLGFLLCLLYSSLRFVLGRSAVAMVLCDVMILFTAALLMRSAAVSRFYSGLPRWYDMAACAGAFFLSRSTMAPILERTRNRLLLGLKLPAYLAWKNFLAPAWNSLHAHLFEHYQKRKKKKTEKSEQEKKKRLQNTGRVLYNSK